MKSVRIHHHGGPEALVIEDVPEPRPRPDEVVVRLRAAGINHLDLWVRKGVPGHPFALPITPGSDGAGVIAETGELARWLEPGQEVIVAPGLSCGHCEPCLGGNENLCRDYGILGETRDGTDAERVCVPARNILQKPPSLSFEEAAAFPLVSLTAWHMLVTRAGVKPGEDVLVHAAGSGVGSMAVEIAKLHGARVFATAGSPEKVRRAYELGADVVIPYQEVDFVEAIRKETGKRGVDIVFEHVGAATWPGSLRSLARGGRLVTCGATTGAEAKLDLRVLFFKNLSVLGSTMGSQAELRQVLRLVEQGRIRPIVDEILPLEDVARAHRLIESRKVFGKVVLKVD